ncbi:CD63 antigen-like [Sitophilus oryzae]|uniref:Tetraspanin n=1 Tax=Sitophilus oryzae TaxID=7048 RepID=A0A6J2YB14_SITOR|nr:CD63 antigen-like [Sitophilus oryzae]
MASQKDLDFGMRCIKYMLCVANVMFVLVGLLLISIGYTIKSIYTNFEEFMETYYYNPATLSIVIGFFIFIIAMFGCVGAIRKSTFLVNTYAFLLSLVLVLEISVCIAAYAMRSNIENNIAYNMRVAMSHYDMEYNAFTWNSTQYNLQCCGVDYYEDWNVYSERTNFPLVAVEVNNQTMHMPTTCCEFEVCTPGSIYLRGCLPRLSSIISQCALLLAVGALCVSMIQVLGIVFAHMLAKSIRKLKTQMLIAKEERRRHFYEQMVKNESEKSKKDIFAPQESNA